MAHSWRLAISLERHRAEEARQTYLHLNSEVPSRYGTIIHEPQHAHASNPSVICPLENSDSSFTEVIRALDEVLSELRALETKYMLQPVSSDGPAIKTPFLLRLKFRINGKRKLKAILGELRRHNEDLKMMTKDLRKTIQCNLAISAHRMNSMNAEPHHTACHITPPQADEGSSMLVTEDLIDLSPSISLDAGEATVVEDPLPPLTSDSTSSAASSRVNMSAGGTFESSTSFISYEHEDNYSINKLRGDKICTHCHQMCRGAGYS